MSPQLFTIDDDATMSRLVEDATPEDTAHAIRAAYDTTDPAVVETVARVADTVEHGMNPDPEDLAFLALTLR